MIPILVFIGAVSGILYVLSGRGERRIERSEQNIINRLRGGRG